MKYGTHIGQLPLLPPGSRNVYSFQIARHAMQWDWDVPVQTLGWGRRARLSLWPVAQRSMTMDGRYHSRNWSSKKCLRTIGLYGSLLTDLKCILLKFLFMCIYVSVCVPHVCGLTEARRGCWPWNWSYTWLWTTWHGCWKLTSGPLEEQQAFLTTEPLPHAHHSIFPPFFFLFPLVGWGWFLAV